MRLIDADALVELLSERGHKYRKKHSYSKAREADAAQCIVRQAPAIEAEPVIHAHWIPKHVINGMTALFDCSNCSARAHVEFMSDRCWFKRCPNCGAWMDGKEE